MKISSPAFRDKGFIPTKYAHQGITGGKNISLPLEWSEVPPGTQSFALSIIDPHPVANNWIHWFVINIPSAIHSLREGASPKNLPSGAKELMNSYGEQGYGGPEPPKGSGPHPYETVMYALNVPAIDLSMNCSRTAFFKALEGNIIARAMITGIFEQ